MVANYICLFILSLLLKCSEWNVSRKKLTGRFQDLWWAAQCINLKFQLTSLYNERPNFLQATLPPPCNSSLSFQHCLLHIQLRSYRISSCTHLHTGFLRNTTVPSYLMDLFSDTSFKSHYHMKLSPSREQGIFFMLCERLMYQFIYLATRVRPIFNPLVHFLRSQRPRAQESPMWMAEAQAFEPSSATFQGITAGSWTGSQRVRTWIGAPTWVVAINKSSSSTVPKHWPLLCSFAHILL